MEGNVLTGDNFHFPAGKFWKTPFVKVITINISLQSVSRESFARSGSYNQPLPHRTSTNQVATVKHYVSKTHAMKIS